VLGTRYVEAVAAIPPFNAEYQDLITRYAWGEMWTRDVFDDRVRRLLVLAMMIALGRWEEFQMHVRPVSLPSYRPPIEGSAVVERDLLRRAVGEHRLPQGCRDNWSTT
jgi:hypothetical protein